MADFDPAVPVERFKPTGGMLVGWVSLAAAVALLVVVPLSEPNMVGVRVDLVIVLVVLLVWMALLRPRATAYADRLVLHNMASDTQLPLAAIDTVLVRTTLNVWMDEKRYVCVGIGRSTRKLVNQRGRGPLTLFGVGNNERRYGFGESADVGASVDYATFVEERIATLARAARKASDGPLPPVRRAPAVPELIGLGVILGALVVSFLF
jgi:hypothetical protein